MGSIWSASAVTPAATDRIPVDVSSSGAPSRWTGQNVADAASRIGVTLNALGSINSNTEIDLANGAFVTATITGSLTFTFSNPPATGQGMQFVLILTNGGSAVVTWPGAVTWTGGTAPTLRSSGVDVLRFYTSNGGANWYGELAYDEQSIDAGAILTGTIDAARLPAGTTSAAGALELATVMEAQAGTDTARAVTPEGVAAAIAALDLAGKLAKASNLSDLTDAAAARTNLGAGAVGAAVFQGATAAAIRALLELGGAALLNIGTAAGTAAAGDHNHTGVYAAAAHNHALGDITQSGATSGQVATWNGTAWVPQTPSGGGSPGGSGSELQYRGGASTFGGASGTHWDAVNGRLSIGAGTSPAGMLHAQASAASVVPLVLQLAASQTANGLTVRNSAASTVMAVLSTGAITAPSIGPLSYSGFTNGAGAATQTFQAGGYNSLYLEGGGLKVRSGAAYGWHPLSTDASAWNGGNNIDTALVRAAAAVVGITNGSTGGGAIEFTAMTAPSAPSAGKGRAWFEDNGSGKLRYMVQFPSGAAQQIAIEP